MAEKSWIFGWAAVRNYLAGQLWKSIAFLRAVQSNVGVLILLLSSVCSKTSWSKFFLGCSRFPYHGHRINEWFAQRFRCEDGREQRVDVINVDREGIRTKIYHTKGRANNFPNSLSDDQFDVFFHGTNHEFAADILEGGIDLSKANRKKLKDFSDEYGYYLCNSFEDAFDWARRNFGPREGQAVLIYRVDKRQLRGENNENGLDLRENETEWLRVVSEYRKSCRSVHRKRGSRPDIDNRLRKELTNKYFIEGPITSDPQRNPSSIDFSSGTYQLCVRNDICAQLFNNSIHSVVFFQE